MKYVTSEVNCVTSSLAAVVAIPSMWVRGSEPNSVYRHCCLPLYKRPPCDRPQFDNANNNNTTSQKLYANLREILRMFMVAKTTPTTVNKPQKC